MEKRENGALAGKTLGEEQLSLLRRIQELSFAKLEAEMFLDTHPTNAEALAYLNGLRGELAEAMGDYAARGFALTADDVRGDSWNWVETPFPWQY